MIELPEPAEYACIGGVSQDIYTASQMREHEARVRAEERALSVKEAEAVSEGLRPESSLFAGAEAIASWNNRQPAVAEVDDTCTLKFGATRDGIKCSRGVLGCVELHTDTPIGALRAILREVEHHPLHTGFDYSQEELDDLGGDAAAFNFIAQTARKALEGQPVSTTCGLAVDDGLVFHLCGRIANLVNKHDGKESVMPELRDLLSQVVIAKEPK